MNDFNSFDFHTILAAMEQRLTLFHSALEQKLEDVVRDGQAQQLFKMGIESIMHSVWLKVCSQRVNISTSCQTEERIQQNFAALPESSDCPHGNFSIEFKEENYSFICAKEGSQCDIRAEQSGIGILSVSSLSTHAGDSSASIAKDAPPTQSLKPAKKSRPQNSYPCTVCEAKFPRKDLLALHQRSHTSVKCKICSRDFTKLYDLKIHSRCHTRNYPFQCNKCEWSFAKIVHLRRHYKIHEEPQYLCTLCGKGYHRPEELAIHMGRHSSKKPYSCQICLQHYSSRQSLSNHVQVYHYK